MRATVLLLLALSACATTRSPSHFQERILATIPEGVEVVGPPDFSADGREVAYIARSGDDYHAVRGTWKSRRLDAL